MRKIKEVLRLSWACQQSQRQVAIQCSISRPCVSEYLRRATDAGLSWPLPQELDDRQLDRLLFPPAPKLSAEQRGIPDWAVVYEELRKKSVTKFLLWQEYRELNPMGYNYSWFCDHYRRWLGKRDLSMRQHHRAGEKLFIDYAGQTVPVVDARTGEQTHAQIFVAVLGASNYTFAEATATQSLPDWIGSHVRAFEFFQAVPEILVPDNLKSGVTKAHRYEPDLNPTYQDMAQHYRSPSIGLQGGLVSASFQHDVFINAPDCSIVELLKHVNSYRHSYDPGGSTMLDSQLIGIELEQATTLMPTKFAALLNQEWCAIPQQFRCSILDGLATHISFRFGNLRPNDDEWESIESPSASDLSKLLLAELERHRPFWNSRAVMGRALHATSYIVGTCKEAERFVFLTIPLCRIREKTDLSRIKNTNNLLTAGINTKTGKVAESLVNLANRLEENGIDYPDLLVPTIKNFAGSEYIAVRALMIAKMPYLYYRNPSLGWELWMRLIGESAELWGISEAVLYRAYNKSFQVIKPMLARMANEASEDDLGAWGRISALSVLSGHLSLTELIQQLNAINSSMAWNGASAVWTFSENIKAHRMQCFNGIKSGLNEDNEHRSAVAKNVCIIFRNTSPLIAVDNEILRLLFSELSGSPAAAYLHRFEKWLNAMSDSEPELALAAAELFIDLKEASVGIHISSYDNNLVQMFNSLFLEAEEVEEMDDGEMLARVVKLQDRYIAAGVKSVDDWLKASERLV